MRCSRSLTSTVAFLGRRVSRQLLAKHCFFLKKFKFFGHVISPGGIQPIAKRVKDLKKLESPESKLDVKKILGCLGLFSCCIKNLHVDSHPFYDLIKDSTPFHWTHDHEKLFQSIKDRISEDTILSVPSTDYLLHIHVDSSNVGTGCILIQQFPQGKRIISFNSRIFDKAEHKMSTLHREFCWIVSALQTYEHYIVGSPFLYTFIVTTKRPFIFGDTKDNNPIGSSGTKP